MRYLNLIFLSNQLHLCLYILTISSFKPLSDLFIHFLIFRKFNNFEISSIRMIRNFPYFNFKFGIQKYPEIQKFLQIQISSPFF